MSMSSIKLNKILRIAEYTKILNCSLFVANQQSHHSEILVFYSNETHTPTAAVQIAQI